MNYANLNSIINNYKYELFIEIGLFYKLKELTKPFNRGWILWILSHIDKLDEEPEAGDSIYINLPPAYDALPVALHFMGCSCDSRRTNELQRRLMVVLHMEHLEWEPPFDDEFPC